MSAVDSIIPLFSLSSSLKQGGIFTVEKAGAMAKSGRAKGPVSLCDLAKEEKLSRLHLVESNMVSFMVAHKNLKEVNCDLAFGLKLVACDDMTAKDEASLRNESKVVIWLAADSGYQSLIKIYSKAAIDGFYYVPRIDWKTLKSMWHESLLLSLPFYSSFLARNTLSFATVVPDLPMKPILLAEDNELPIDGLIGDAVVRYAAAEGIVPQAAKTIYYRTRADAKAWQVWRAILERQSYERPNMDHCGSREFSWEAFKEETT